MQKRCNSRVCVTENCRTFKKSKLYSALMLSRKNLLVQGARAEIFLLSSHHPLHLPLRRIPRVCPPRPRAVKEACRVSGGTVVSNPRSPQREQIRFRLNLSLKGSLTSSAPPSYSRRGSIATFLYEPDLPLDTTRALTTFPNLRRQGGGVRAEERRKS